MVASDPEWPVLSESRSVRASVPRTSPTMIRSGPAAERDSEEFLEVNGLLVSVSLALEADDIWLVDQKLGGIFDGHDPLVVGDGLRQYVKQGRLSRPGAAANEDGLTGPNLPSQELRKRTRERAARDQVISGEMATCELADGEARKGLHGRWNVGANAAAVGQPRLKDRIIFIEPFAEIVGDGFEAGTKASRLKGNARLREHLAVAFGVPDRVGIPMISFTSSSSSSGSMGRRNGQSSSKLIGAPLILSCCRNR